MAAVWGTVVLASACGGGGTQTALSVDAGDGGPRADAAPGPEACVPGQQIACTCPGGATGDQVCLPNGSGYGTCEGCDGETDGPAELPDATPDSAGITDSATPDAKAATDASRDANEPLDAKVTDAPADAPPADALADAADASCVKATSSRRAASRSRCSSSWTAPGA